MARITARKGKKGTTYQATVRRKGHKTRTATFDTIGEARAWAGDIESDMRNRRYVDPREAEISLEAALEKYNHRYTSKKALSTQQRERRCATYLIRALGSETLLPDISPRVVAKFRDDRLEQVSAYSVRLELALLSHLFRKAIAEWELPLENPVDKIERPKAPAGKKVFLKPDEAARFLEECSRSRNRMLYPFVLVLLHSAMRSSETALLKWRQIDLDNRSLILWETKNEDFRTVPLTWIAVEALSGIRNGKEGDELVFLKREPRSDHARAVPSSAFRDAFEHARMRAGLKWLTMHTLRHTAASYMLMRGVDIRTLAAILGHKTLQMVLRYTHLNDDHLKKAIDSIGDLGLLTC